MKTSSDGRKFIEVFEGLALKAYKDSVRVWTIGYGHTSAAGPPTVRPGMTIDRETADNILANDLARVEYNVASCIHGPLTQDEFDALVSFDFNTGKLKAGSIDDKINRGDKAAAMATLLQYNHADGRVLRGLTRRRKGEKVMFEGDMAKALRIAGTPSMVSVSTGGAIAAGAAVAIQQGLPPQLIAVIVLGIIGFVAFKFIKKRGGVANAISYIKGRLK